MEAGEPQAPIQTATAAFGGFGLDQLFEHLARRPAGFGGARQDVVQVRGYSTQTDLLELGGEAIHRGRRRGGGRVHRRSPDCEAAPRWIALRDDG